MSLTSFDRHHFQILLQQLDSFLSPSKSSKILFIVAALGKRIFFDWHRLDPVTTFSEKKKLPKHFYRFRRSRAFRELVRYRWLGIVAAAGGADIFCFSVSLGLAASTRSVTFFLLLAQSANFFCVHLFRLTLPQMVWLGFYPLTPMLKLGMELRSVQLHLFVGPYLRTLYRLSYRSHEEVLLVGFNEPFLKYLARMI